MAAKKGQMEVTFNWVYILIAGAVILLFFIGIVARQKSISEQRLSGEVVRILESIFTGAGVSEKTKNFIDTSGLAEYTLFFDCDSGVGTYGIKDSSARVENSIDPIFALRELQTAQLIVWSMPYKLPYKVVDLLFVSSANTHYVIMGEGELADELLNATKGFAVQRIQSVQDIVMPANGYVRIVDTTGNAVVAGGEVPEPLRNSHVSAVVLGRGKAQYYRVREGAWKQSGSADIISLAGEQDAALYAAMFAADENVYECNMQKAFRRLELLNIVYGGKEIVRGEAGGKLGEMMHYYEWNQGQNSKQCLDFLKSTQPNVLGALASHQRNAGTCRLDAKTCPALVLSAQELRKANKNLAQLGDCITLY